MEDSQPCRTDLVTTECAPASGPPQWSRGAVSRLPPEILEDIFMQNVLQVPAQRGRYYGLFNFLFVCWRWYSVARCSPYLWCHLGSNINHWPVFVALSKGVDLFIHMYDIYAEYRAIPDDHLNAMFRDHGFYSRIREFTLDGQVDVLSHIFPKDTPRPSRLVLLSITRWVAVSGRRVDPTIPELLVESSSESLKRLSVSGCSLDIDQLPIVRQLTHLSLAGVNYPCGCPTLKQLLLVFQANPSLEELLLDYGCSLQLDEDEDEDPPFIFFTRLRKLRMKLEIQDVAPLLQYLRIPSEIEEIEFKVECPWYHREPILETISSWLNDAVSPQSVQYIEARPAAPMSRPGIKYVRKSDSIQYPNLPHHSSFVEVRSEKPSELSAFLASEILRNVTRLELFHDDFLASQFLEIFEMAPMLRELIIWVGRECDSIRALFPTMQDDQEDLESRACLSYVPLRSLSYLRIIGANFRDIEDDDSDPNQEIIMNFIRQRKLFGLELQRLELVCCQYVFPDWVDELRKFVSEIFWDGQDGVGEANLGDSDEDYCPYSSDLDDSDSDDSGGGAGLCDSDKDSYALFSLPEDLDSDEESYPSSSSSDSDDSDEGVAVSSESTDWVLGD